MDERELEKKIEDKVVMIVKKNGNNHWMGWVQLFLNLLALVFVWGMNYQTLKQHGIDIENAKETDKTIMLKVDGHTDKIHLIELNQERYNNLTAQILSTLGEMKGDVKSSADAIAQSRIDIVEIKGKVNTLTKD
jgi:Tfp pilus assembly protein PilO